MEWKDVTVFQWQQLVELFTGEYNELELMVNSASILYGITINQIDNYNAKELKEKLNGIKFIHNEIKPIPQKYIQIKNKRYRCIYDVRKIQAARYIESKYHAKDVNNSLHKIAASMVMPQKKNLFGRWVDDKYDVSKHGEYSDDMLNAPITAVLGSVVFFCNVYLNWIKNSKGYLIEQMETTMTKDQVRKMYQDLWNNMAGYIKPNWFQDIKTSN